MKTVISGFFARCLKRYVVPTAGVTLLYEILGKIIKVPSKVPSNQKMPRRSALA